MQESNDEEDQIMSISTAAAFLNVDRQAVYVAIVKRKKLKAAQLKSGRWEIKKSDLIEYQKNKYSRENSVFEGTLLYDTSKGECSVNHLAKLLGEPPQHIYYLLRTGQIKGRRKGSVWVISYEDAIRIYKERHPDLEQELKFREI